MEVDRIVCSDPVCCESLPNHRWAKVKAEDWFFMKDGTVFCPAHVPSWVAEWRRKRKSRHLEGSDSQRNGQKHP